MAIDYTKYLAPIGNRFYSCSCCGKHLKENDLGLDCADCGAIFCEECVRNGEVEGHECENDELEDKVD